MHHCRQQKPVLSFPEGWRCWSNQLEKPFAVIPFSSMKSENKFTGAFIITSWINTCPYKIVVDYLMWVVSLWVIWGNPKSHSFFTLFLILLDTWLTTMLQASVKWTAQPMLIQLSSYMLISFTEVLRIGFLCCIKCVGSVHCHETVVLHTSLCASSANFTSLWHSLCF
jgi:hypothetical protein